MGGIARDRQVGHPPSWLIKHIGTGHRRKRLSGRKLTTTTLLEVRRLVQAINIAFILINRYFLLRVIKYFIQNWNSFLIFQPCIKSTQFSRSH